MDDIKIDNTNEMIELYDENRHFLGIWLNRKFMGKNLEEALKNEEYKPMSTNGICALVLDFENGETGEVLKDELKKQADISKEKWMGIFYDAYKCTCVYKK